VKTLRRVAVATGACDDRHPTGTDTPDVGDDVISYTTDIRTHIIDHHGHPPRVYRDIYDPGEAGSSLWSKTTQRKMKEAKERRDALPTAVVTGGRSTPW